MIRIKDVEQKIALHTWVLNNLTIILKEIQDDIQKSSLEENNDSEKSSSRG